MALSTQEQNDLQAIVCYGDAKLLVENAKKLGEELANLESHQIRRFFGTVRQIKATWREDNPDQAKKAQRELLLLKPKLAYQRGRMPGKIAKLEDVLSYAIDLVEEEKTHFNNFIDFFEALVAYHRAYRGRD